MSDYGVWALLYKNVGSGRYYTPGRFYTTILYTQYESNFFFSSENGGWSNWVRWSPCSKTCGTGAVKVRQRYCDNPQPKYGGAKCKGASIQQVSCKLPLCPGRLFSVINFEYSFLMLHVIISF